MPVLLIGTLDTKSAEIGFVRDLLHAAGLQTLVADAGILGTPGLAADIPREQFFAAAGFRIDELQSAADRGKAVTAATVAAEKLATQLHRDTKLQGVLGLGGSAGTTIGSAAMRALPYGIPKLLVSTLASGQVSHYIGVRDILLLHSVVDLCGLNRFNRQILNLAAGALIGMIQAQKSIPAVPANRVEPRTIAATMFGVTTPCVERSRKIIEEHGFEGLVFHATGTGGRTMEAMIRDGLIAGVLDLTTTELADELVGGILSAGPDRLTAAALRGVPQVISVGALDMVNFGPPDTVPKRFEGRKFYFHNANVTLMRTTPEENDQLGKEIAQKASASNSPVALMIPKRGVSAIDKEGGAFWWPEADAALFQSIRNWIGPQVELIELDLHINDPPFADAAAAKLLAML